MAVISTPPSLLSSRPLGEISSPPALKGRRNPAQGETLGRPTVEQYGFEYIPLWAAPVVQHSVSPWLRRGWIWIVFLGFCIRMAVCISFLAFVHVFAMGIGITDCQFR
jgi:hypothetical protein